MIVQIKSWITKNLIFETEVSADIAEKLRIKMALEEAVKVGANLDGASLVGANLDGASLDGANLNGANLTRASLDGANFCRANLGNLKLIDGGLRSDGYRFLLTDFDGEGRLVKAGCHFFTPAEARAHWQKKRGGTPLGDETFAILDHMERLAELLGWNKVG